MTQTSPPAQPSLLSSSAVMAAGTIVSRLSGQARNMLLVAALGNGLHADVFNIANTIPNMLYILLAGGVFNAVLVPQLVRAIKRDPDGGTAYTNRLITLAALFLAGATAVLVIGTPLLMRLFLDPHYFTTELTAQRESAMAFARYCLPQVFFYGMFVLLGQVLNARGVFGPMMWAPIANNVVAVAVLVAYLVQYGPASGDTLCGGYHPGQELLLGVGSTAGIALQFALLIPYLRKSGYRFRARSDFRGTGLGHTLRLGVWTVLFVVVNQIAFTIVVRLASSGTAPSVSGCGVATESGATGYTIYSNAYLLVMVPHSVIVVSLATAMLPRLSSYAADHDLATLGRSIGRTLRTTYALLLPLLALVPVVALPASRAVYGYGAGADSYASYVPSLSLFAVGQVFFTAHYLLLRGFYALEQNRRVFFIQCAVAATNIVVAVLLTLGHPPPSQTAPRLVIAYGLSFVVGAALTYSILGREVGGLGTRATVRFFVRAGIATAVAIAGAWAVVRLAGSLTTGGGLLPALAVLVVAGLTTATLYLLVARALRLREVTDLAAQVVRRLPSRLRRGTP